MNKIDLLKSKKSQLFSIGKAVRDNIASLIDEKSFVELDTFSYSNGVGGEQGEGVVTGFATINEYPVYIVGVNHNFLSGGFANAMCQKIVRCLDKANDAGSPVIYLLESDGVLLEDGVGALEGVAKVIAKMDELKGCVPQFAVSTGKVLGSASIIASLCDYNYFVGDACVCYDSPLVLSAKSDKILDEGNVGGVKSTKYNGICDFAVKNIAEVKNSIANIIDILPDFGGYQLETMDDLNRATLSLNEKACAKCLTEAVFDKDYFIELGKGFADSVVTGIGRIGGYSCGAIIFNGEDGVELDKDIIEKVKDFIYYAGDNNLPVVTFVNTLGIKKDLATNNTTVLKSIGNLICALNNFDAGRINVIYGKAIGLGYTLFGSKVFGVNYSFSFANALIGPVDIKVGAEVLYNEKGGNKEDLQKEYEEKMDAVVAAENGFIDDVIEPQFVRQYIISALQML